MHHDNFDCWNSQHQRWNAVHMGPRRDIAGEWQQAARKAGLRFGMTEHLAASWWFYSAAKQADKRGPLAGVPYDGVDPRYADLYWRGNEKPDGHYYLAHAPQFVQQTWFERIKDLIDRYQPDLLYSDSPLPYPEAYGRALLTHYYNDNVRRLGSLQAVYTCKQDAQGRWVQDLERGVMGGIHPEPWQTDTCVGGWYYHEGRPYKSTTLVLQMLADIVSKNGNLLLNFPPRPDGTLDAEELKILAELAAWMPVNGEAIFGTRPWLVYGEGPARVQSGGFNEGHLRYTSRDIRFTTKGDTLYALALAWPEDRRLVVRSLAAPAGKINAVHLLGHAGPLDWRQTAEGLVVRLPEQKPCAHVFALKIAASELAPVPVAAEPLAPLADGRIVLGAADAEIHGTTPRYETGGGKDQIGYWANPRDFVSWRFQLKTPGRFTASVTYSCSPGAQGSAFTVAVAGQQLPGRSQATGSWATYTTQTLGQFTLPAGIHTLSLKPQAEPRWKVIGLKSIELRPVKP